MKQQIINGKRSKREAIFECGEMDNVKAGRKAIPVSLLICYFGDGSGDNEAGV